MRPLYRIEKIEDPKEKSRIAEEVLLDLPEWFGLPESTQNYIREAEDLPFWAAIYEVGIIGFITLSESSPETGSLHAIGVKKAHHWQGIGTALYRELEDYARTKYKYLQVKTVNEGHYKEYDQTVSFYKKLGFSKLEVFPDLWDPWNPCLVMIKALAPPEDRKEKNLILYYASPIRGLTRLEPQPSIYGASCVQAVEDPVLALILGTKEDDKDFIQDLDLGGIPRISECYAGAFEKIYQDLSASLYRLEGGSSFHKDKANWEPQYTSEEAVEIAEETFIPDLHTHLLEEEGNGRLVIRRYEDNLTYKQMIARHVVNRLLRAQTLEMQQEHKRITSSDDSETILTEDSAPTRP